MMLTCKESKPFEQARLPFEKDGVAAEDAAAPVGDPRLPSCGVVGSRPPDPHNPYSGKAAVDLLALVDRVQSGDPQGMEELYRIFARGVRFYLCRHLGSQEIEDKVHDTFVLIVQAIMRGELREPERLMGYVRTVVRRQVAAHIDDAVHYRKEQLDVESGVAIPDATTDPEKGAIWQQKSDLMECVLRRLSRRDREILTRFYLDEQPQEQICEEMNLSDTQFRLLKSRAKSRFGEIGKKKVLKKPIRSIFVRTSLSA